jgi:hypothetical protein
MSLLWAWAGSFFGTMVNAGAMAPRRGETLKEASKEKDVRLSNIVAAKGKPVGTILGPVRHLSYSHVFESILTGHPTLVWGRSPCFR